MGFRGTLLGGAFGWALGGPIGAVVGGLVGDRVGRGRKKRGADAAVALAVLLAAVTKAGGRAEPEASAGVRSFLGDAFGPDNADDLMRVYERAFRMDLDMEAIGAQLREALDEPSRLELLHVLFRLVAGTGQDSREAEAVREAGAALGIAADEVRGAESLHRSGRDRAYAVLGAAPGDSAATIKKKYRGLAKKYHPDRVAHLGDEFRALAEERFKAIQEAFEAIEKAEKK